MKAGSSDDSARVEAPAPTDRSGAHPIREALSAFGIDVALLDQNLARSHADRLGELESTVRLVESAQARALSQEARRRLRARALAEDVSAYGRPDDIDLLDALGHAES